MQKVHPTTDGEVLRIFCTCDETLLMPVGHEGFIQMDMTAPLLTVVRVKSNVQRKL